MGSIEDLVRDLRGFDADAEVARALRTELAKPAPAVIRQIRGHAVAILPGGGGLGGWVAASKIATRVRLAGRTVSVRLIASRRSLRGASDLNAINRGRVRHPEWGRRRPGQWHIQLVRSGWFTDAPADTREWAAAIDRGTDEALAKLRHA